ncbi:putative histone H2B type 2-D [Carcharodon carcharias]|uniref:putative histone H2B type 2-D n=1 Tax=Carcharodon carcharias TaxID=13397 RepID=UPI001B7EFEE2|nr:putative histone H2B type 2-D [Carcharodon carcharias]
MPEVVAVAKGGASHQALKRSLTKVTKKPPKKRRKSCKQSYSTYVYKGLTQVHPPTRASSKAMSVMNSFIVDVFKCVASPRPRTSFTTKSAAPSRRGRSRALSASCCQGNWPNTPSPKA